MRFSDILFEVVVLQEMKSKRRELVVNNRDKRVLLSSLEKSMKVVLVVEVVLFVVIIYAASNIQYAVGMTEIPLPASEVFVYLEVFAFLFFCNLVGVFVSLLVFRWKVKRLWQYSL